MATDPICGMTVDPNNAAGKHKHNGQTYYFCSKHCAAKFSHEPNRFVTAATQSPAAAYEQSVKDTRVIDPVCGMSVEPTRAAARHEHNGRSYYFCSRHCLAKFQEAPETFLCQSHGGRKKEVLAEFGDRCRRYMDLTPAFIPHFGRDRQMNEA